jgi:hypothetical protein
MSFGKIAFITPLWLLTTTAIYAAPPLPKGGDHLFSADHVLWDHWYTVTVGKADHYEYYNDHAEMKKGRVIFQNHAWKKEENFINEEQVGSFAENSPELPPLFFNFHSTYRSTETSIDGNVKDRQLTVRVRKGETEMPLIKKGVAPKAFLSELFPVWLGYHLASFKVGQVQGFQTIIEDNLEAGFGPVSGQVRVEPADEFAKRTHTTKLLVDYQGIKSNWWVEEVGAPLRIEMPLQKIVVERVTREKAQAFLRVK